jgi:ubiquitin-activating enzyme E1
LKKIYPYYKKLELKEINEYFEILISKSYEKAIEYSYYNLKKKFNFEIEDILNEHPVDSKDKYGNNFYSGAKHEPKLLDFNINKELDKLIICYIKSYANLIFNTLGLKKIEKVLNDEDIKSICLKTKIDNNNEINKKSFISKIIYNKEYCQKFIDDLKLKLKEKLVLDSIDQLVLNEVIFKKDNLTNFQYDFIYSCTNLRAYNFQIPQWDYIKIKTVSSNIIPSIITSNAVITGLASMQLYLLAKLLVEKEKYNNNIIETEQALKLFRNYYIYLGLNGYTLSNLAKKIIHSEKNDIPKGWSDWDTIELKGPMKISEFLKQLEANYNIKINSIHSGKSMIYKKDDPEEIQELNVNELYEKIIKTKIESHRKYLIFDILAKNLLGEEVNLPRVKYFLK